MMNGQGHFRHEVSSLLGISALLEPAQVNRWKTSAKSILLRIRSDHILEKNVSRCILELLEVINVLTGLQKFHLVIRGQRGRLRASVVAAILETAQNMTTLEICNAFIKVDTSEWNDAIRTHPCLESVAMLDCRPSSSNSGNSEAASLLPFIGALTENPRLTKFILESKALHGTGDVTAIMTAIGQSTSIESFKLCNCKDNDGLDEEQISSLLQAMHTNQTMTDLCIYDESPAMGRFGAATSAAFAEMLRGNTQLESIMLSLQPVEVPPIIDALRDNTTLKKIRLHAQYQSCFAAVMENLAKVLRHDNFVLEDCQLGSSNSGSGVGGGLIKSQVEYFLTLNRLGRNFLFTNEEATTEDWVNTVCSHQDRTDVVMYFLRTNPSLIKQTDQPVYHTDKSSWKQHSNTIVANQSDIAVVSERNRRHKH